MIHTSNWFDDMLGSFTFYIVCWLHLMVLMFMNVFKSAIILNVGLS